MTAGKRILVVDDEPLVCQTLRMLLHADGHEVKEAQSAHQALEIFATHSFDLVFTDFSMPGMDGYELARSIRGHDAADAAVPIVLITGYPLRSPSEEVCRIIMKPFSASSIRATLAELAA